MRTRLIIALVGAAAVIGGGFLLLRRPAHERLVFSYETYAPRVWEGDCRCAAPVANATTVFFCGGYFWKRREQLVAVDLRTRAVKWARALTEGCGPMLATDDAIYSWDGEAVTAFDTAGRTLWRRRDLVGRPFIVAGQVYIGRRTGPAFIVLDSRTREPVDEVAVPALPSAPPLVDGTVVRYGTLDGRLVALDLTSGAVTTMPMADRILSPLARAGALVVFHAETRGGFALVGFDPQAGVTRWAVPTGRLSQATPAVVGDEVFLGADQLLAVNATTGAVRRMPLEGDGPIGNVVPYDGTLYVAAGRVLQAVDPATGTVAWRFSARGWLDDPPTGGVPLLRDGVLYVGSRDCRVYGLRLGRPTPPPPARTPSGPA